MHEHGAQQGFHSHILLTLPGALAPAFEAWSRKILTELTKHPGDATSVVVRAPQGGDSVKRGWYWMRYCLKQLTRQTGISYNFEPSTPCATSFAYGLIASLNEADAEGINWWTLRRASEGGEIGKRKDGFGGWHWWLA